MRSPNNQMALPELGGVAHGSSRVRRLLLTADTDTDTPDAPPEAGRVRGGGGSACRERTRTRTGAVARATDCCAGEGLPPRRRELRADPGHARGREARTGRAAGGGVCAASCGRPASLCRRQRRRRVGLLRYSGGAPGQVEARWAGLDPSTTRGLRPARTASERASTGALRNPRDKKEKKRLS